MQCMHTHTSPMKNSLLAALALLSLGFTFSAYADSAPLSPEEDSYVNIREYDDFTNMAYPFDSFAIALVLTVALELSVLFFLSKTALKTQLKGVSAVRLFLCGFAASTITLPILWYILPRFFSSYAAYVTAGEILVFVLEAALYAFVLHIRSRDALVLSFTCNACSFFLGYAVQRMIY